ncbi:MAG: hypothetical protein LKJ47_04755 [Bifidobacteriaceae bacterium]|jgi:hypothetical protein|nr:hypothetical protein [Bifidobacteriaceae bacterium]
MRFLEAFLRVVMAVTWLLLVITALFVLFCIPFLLLMGVGWLAQLMPVFHLS